MANDTIVIPISTTTRISPTHVELDKGEGDLDQTSMAKCEQISTLDKSFLIRGPFSGTIRSSKMVKMEMAIKLAIGTIELIERQ